MLKAVLPSLLRGGLVKCAFVLALLSTPVQAQEPWPECGPSVLNRAVMTEQGAWLVAVMRASGGVQLEIWSLTDGSRFRLFYVKEGQLCLITEGTNLVVVSLPGQGA
jgi:hypothetical protein